MGSLTSKKKKSKSREPRMRSTGRRWTFKNGAIRRSRRFKKGKAQDRAKTSSSSTSSSISCSSSSSSDLSSSTTSSKDIKPVVVVDGKRDYEASSASGPTSSSTSSLGHDARVVEGGSIVRENSSRSSSSSSSYTSSSSSDRAKNVAVVVAQKSRSSSSSSSISDNEARIASVVIAFQESRSCRLTSSSSSSSHSTSTSDDEARDVAILAAQAHIRSTSESSSSSTTSLSSSSSSSSKEMVMVHARIIPVVQNYIIDGKSTNSSFSSSHRGGGARDVDGAVFAQKADDSSRSSSSSDDNSARHMQTPSAAVMTTTRTFSKGTVLTISALAKYSPELMVHQDASANMASGEFTIPLPSDRPGSHTLISAITSAFQEKPDLNLAKLLTTIGSKMRESGSLLLPQLSGMTGANLHARADFLDAPKFVSDVRALLVGVNSYGDAGFSRTNASGDLRAFRNCLISHGWPTATSQMRVLTDDKEFKNCSSSYRNILRQLHWLVDGTTAGSARLFVFVGACSTVGNESALLPKNFDFNHLLTESTIYNELIASLPDGANMTAIFSSPNGGTGIHLPLTIAMSPHVEKKIGESILLEDSRLFFAENPQFRSRI